MYGNEEAVGEGLQASGVCARRGLRHDQGLARGPRAGGSAPLGRGEPETARALTGRPPSDPLAERRIPLAGTIRALCDAKRGGLARHIGVANFTVRLLDEAVAAADEPIVANQCEYHPYLDQRAVLSACRRHGVAFISYCPLGKAQVLGEPAIQAIAKAHGRTPAQIVLRWHLQQGVAAIPKSGTPARIAENLAVFDFALADEEMAAISRPRPPAAGAWSRPPGRPTGIDPPPRSGGGSKP